MNERTSQQVWRFVLCGGVGFIADLTVLWWLHHQQDWGLMSSRVVAFGVAITITYLLNARFTFRVPLEDALFHRYLGVQLVGAGINLGMYALLVFVGPMASVPMLALTIGAMVATFSNFLLSRRYVYLR